MLGIEMKQYISIALICLLAVPAFATRQIQDKLNYEGKVYEIGGHTDFPLEVYFRSQPKEEQVKKYKILQPKGI
ncbi:MAG TPA: hypothetical protein VJ904_08925, partial [Tichowtungia sp.]|nr:hypothetical protein [Tichowtungia sp.]